MTSIEVKSRVDANGVLNPTYTFEEYLAQERIAAGKSEFYRGQIFAMAGGSPRHNTIGVNLVVSLRGRLRGSPCRTFNSDQRIRIPANGLATCPDVSVICMLELRTLASALPLSEIYEDVRFGPDEDAG